MPSEAQGFYMDARELKAKLKGMENEKEATKKTHDSQMEESSTEIETLKSL